MAWVLSARRSRAGTGLRLVTYRWALGHRLLGVRSILHHAFPNGRPWTVTLTVTDNRGAVSKTRVHIR